MKGVCLKSKDPGSPSATGTGLLSPPGWDSPGRLCQGLAPLPVQGFPHLQCKPPWHSPRLFMLSPALPGHHGCRGTGHLSPQDTAGAEAQHTPPSQTNGIPCGFLGNNESHLTLSVKCVSVLPFQRQPLEGAETFGKSRKEPLEGEEAWKGRKEPLEGVFGRGRSLWKEQEGDFGRSLWKGRQHWKGQKPLEGQEGTFGRGSIL